MGVKGWIRALALTLVLLLPYAALADVKKGDTGDEVLEIQTILQETGWLFEEPDGVFGSHTEQALINWQQAQGLDATGTADDDTMEALRQHWSDVFGEPYQGNEKYAPDPMYDVCHYVTAGDGSVTMQYCHDHTQMLGLEDDLLKSGTAEDAAAAALLWQEEAERMYSQWLENAADAQKLGILSAMGAFRAYCLQTRAALEALWPEDQARVEKEMCTLLKAQVLSLCEYGVEYGAGGLGQ